ncbi:hypothetical protein, partial [Salmonella enterica]
LSLLLNIAGRYQLVAMDESGQVAAVNFELIIYYQFFLI